MVSHIQRLFADGGRVANGDGIDADVDGSSHFGGVYGGHGAAGVVAIGEHDQDTIVGVTFLEQFDGQADGVTEHGTLASHTDFGFRQQLRPDQVIVGEG